jgi:hypothetical protein
MSRSGDIDWAKRNRPERKQIASSMQLSQNYPNPFSTGSGATITYSLREASDIVLRVYDLLGRVVRTLSSGRMDAGAHSVNVPAGLLSPGLYVYTLETCGSVVSRNMVVIR